MSITIKKSCNKCADCIHCLKTLSVSSKTNTYNEKYFCGKNARDTYKYNTCYFFEAVND